MGFKARKKKDKQLRRAVLSALEEAPLSRKQLLGALRSDVEVTASKRTLSVALERLIRKGKVVLEGARGNAQFRRSSPV